jgi:ATP-dependent Lon protease
MHLHVPRNRRVPKDGPSAGVTLFTARRLAAARTRPRALSIVAMTGEISLRGKVLPVGGIKEKLLAARRAGIDTVVIPRRNEKDLVDVPSEVRAALGIHLVDTIDEALALTLSARKPTTPAAA